VFASHMCLSLYIPLGQYIKYIKINCRYN
jgi:hypothetical protein